MKIHFIGSILMIAFLQLQTQSLLAQADAPKAVLTRPAAQNEGCQRKGYWRIRHQHFLIF
jgi:hypothetical protein